MLMGLQGTAKALALPAADRAAVRTHASAAQWDEWDDEYDDSFDDLGMINLDGTADVEGAMPGHASRLCLSLPLLPSSSLL